MIPPKRIEIGWRDLAAAFFGGSGPGLEPEPLGGFLPPDETLATLSVRSGFDLLLTALAYPAGTEVIVSAVTIADMGRILEAHGLVPVPVDLDMATLSVSPDAVRACVTDRTRAILVAHVFGSRMELDGVAAVAREHDLLLVEDCAQAFDGPRYAGAPGADVVMFSFGPIKTLTCLGGGLIRVRRSHLRQDMVAIHDTWPRQPTREFRRRVLKYAAICCLLSPPLYGLFARMLGGRHQELLKASVRGFSGPGFFRRIRRRPSAGLLATMSRRLRRAGVEAIDRRARRGNEVAKRLDRNALPGARAGYHSHWVFPVLVQEPDAAIHRLRRAGADASRGATSLSVLEPDESPGARRPEQARSAMAHVVFLPVHPEVPDAVVDRMIRILNEELLPAARGVGHA